MDTTTVLRKVNPAYAEGIVEAMNKYPIEDVDVSSTTKEGKTFICITCPEETTPQTILNLGVLLGNVECEVANSFKSSVASRARSLSAKPSV
jgi:hypothetical protein